MTREEEQFIEKKLIRIIVDDAILQGWSISVNNGGDENELDDCRDAEEVVKSLGLADEDALILKRQHPDGAANHFQTSYVRLIYGNSPWEVAADWWTPSADEVLKRYEQAAAAMETLHGVGSPNPSYAIIFEGYNYDGFASDSWSDAVIEKYRLDLESRRREKLPLDPRTGFPSFVVYDRNCDTMGAG